jgi:hypothetical protein
LIELVLIPFPIYHSNPGSIESKRETSRAE